MTDQQRSLWPSRSQLVLLVSAAGDTATRLELMARDAQPPMTLRVVTSLDETLSTLGNEDVATVVCDLTPEGRASLDVIAAAEAAAPGVPIVALVESVTSRTATEALRHGAHDSLARDADAFSLGRVLRLLAERQHLVGLVAAGVTQRHALAQIERRGNQAVTVTGALDVVGEEIAWALPRVDVCVGVHTPEGDIAHGRAQVREQATAERWPFDSDAGEGEILVCAPPGRPLTEHERTFLERVAHMAAVTLNALTASSALRLRTRQLELLYELSQRLLRCRLDAEVVELVPAAVRAAVGQPDDTLVELALRGSTGRAGQIPPTPTTEARSTIQVAGTPVGSLTVIRGSDVHNASAQTVIAQVVQLVEDWLARRHAEEERDSRRVWLELLLNELPAVIWTVDRDLRFTSLTGSGLAGIDPPPRLGQTLVDHFDGDEDHVSVRHHREALEGASSAYTLAWLDLDWEVAVTPLHDQGGRIVGATGVGLDVTARQAALRRAERERQRYQALFEQSLDAIILTDDVGIITDVNPAMVELSGRSASSLVGARVLDLVSDAPSEEKVAAGRAERERQGSLHGTARLARPDGTPVEVAYSSRADVLEGTNLTTLRDITARVQAQRALEASEVRFRDLAEQAVEGIFRIQLAPERSFEYTNPALQRITGFGHGAFVDDPRLLVHRTHPDDVDGDAGRNRTVRFQRADDEWRWLEVRQSPVTDEDGTITAIQGLVTDVTDQKRHAEALEAALVREQQATEDLRRVDELKNAFLRAASHELRTPLSAIYGLAATLNTRRDELDEQTTEHLWARLDVNVERLRTLLDDLLDINRLTMREVTPALADVDLAEVVSGATAEVPMGHRSLSLDLMPTAASVEASKVARIVHNLLANAVKHTPEGTTVVVRTHPGDDGSAVLVVADDGPGIDPDIRDTLFEPFVQGRSASTSPQPGTGIGLSLVQQFTELHRGTVSVADNDGGGARFEVVFPAHAAD